MGNEQSKKRTGSTLGQRIIAVACVALVGLALLAGISYGLWRLLAELGHGTLAALALGAILAVPVTGAACWKLGHLEARGVLGGLALGVNTVTQAAVNVADVRVITIRTIREVQTRPEAMLPKMIDITPRHLSDGEAGEIYL